ncbi:hypothetical protein [Mesorhizobium sp. M0767]|uniref:hypothetical protein n=1 Tax=Mesorhizobium sp. M0767 TaxID=2956995 RepID=UPI00333BFD24
MAKIARARKTAAASEATLWMAQKTVAERALDFAIAFLGCRSLGSTLDATARGRLLTILRAVSWVESRHGTAGANQPGRDPLQCGNPADTWWKMLTEQSGDGDRFIRGPGLTNLWANEIATEGESTTGFPLAAAMGKLSEKKNGHADAGFSPTHSYVWGVIFLIHKINTSAGDKSYDCGDLARDRLVDGAVAYNGRGDSGYRGKIEAALKEIGDLSFTFATADFSADQVAAASGLVAGLIAASNVRGQARAVARTSLTFDPLTGRIISVEVEFDHQ